MIRIAITGPESSGKTTLSQQLGLHFQIPVAPEFARIFLESSNGSYCFSDLDLIAQGQVDAWETLDTSLLCDTEMTVMKIWSEVKFKKISPLIQKCYLEQRFDHYFLCRPDIPWEPDPLRENPNDRNDLFERYQKELKLLNRPFTIIEGSEKDRKDHCIQIIEELFPFFKK